MKIVILTSEFPPGPGGIGDHAYNLAKQLVKKNYDVTVISEYRAEFASQWKNVKSSATVKYAQRSKVLPNIGFLLLFVRFFLTTRETTWIATGSKSLTLLGVGLFLSKRKSLAILHGHEMLEDHGLKSHIRKKFLKYFTKAVAVSAFSKENSKLFMNADKISVIPNGFNHAKYRAQSNLKAASHNLNLLTVGRISKRKGQHNVVRALPSIIQKHPDVVYHMVGINSDIDFLIAQAGDLGLQNNIRTHGVLTDEQLASLFQQIDIFLMLSENQYGGDVEGFGIAIIEANYFGIPAIGSLGCGVEQAVKNGYSGKLVPFDKPVDIAAAIEDILNKYSVYSENARKWSNDHFWSSIINQYMKVLLSL
ncbi:MAG: glycosyltransferase family 4 protein [Cyclobacteriaceae bacterium]